MKRSAKRHNARWFGETYSVSDAVDVKKMFAEMQKPRFRQLDAKREYSVTGDVLSFLRCARQYGLLGPRGYVPAQSGQLFFGTVIHETLDRAHAHFKGELPGTSVGEMPTDRDIRTYFEAVEQALRHRGIRPMSRQAGEQALEYVTRFNREQGQLLYPRVVDTEHRLQNDEGKFVLSGIVDVLATSADAVETDRPKDYEIWDYKGSMRPPARSPDLKNYEFQMRVYAHLYRVRHGVTPGKAILWFLGEREPQRASYEVALTEDQIKAALNVFAKAVGGIGSCRRESRWPAPAMKSRLPSKQTCDACDFRWGCPAPFDKPYRPRYP